MTLISKNLYIEKLDHIVNKYNNTYHSTIKMKPVDVRSSTFIDLLKEFRNAEWKEYNNKFNSWIDKRDIV